MTTPNGEYRVRKKRQQAEMCGTPTEEIVTDRVVRRFLLRAGLLHCSPPMIEATQRHLHDLVDTIVDGMNVLMQYDRRINLQVDDVLRACHFHGITIYGYDDMCVLPGGQYRRKYHVTEMLEACTIFSNPKDWDEDEVDLKTGSRFTKTNFVENYQTFCRENGDDEDSDYSDGEWSWYGDSDVDSDEEHESDMEEEEDTDTAESNLTASAEPSGRELLLEALQEAQEVVDNQLCYDEPEGEETEAIDAEEPFGQGYHSDFDEEHEPKCMGDWNERVNKEECIWEQKQISYRAKEDQLQAFLDAENSEEAMVYLIPRHTFYRLFRSISRYTVPISAVALSALHNVVEHEVMRSLVNGSLRVKLMTMELQNVAEAVEETCHPKEHEVNHVDAMREEREQEMVLKSQQLAQQLEEECAKTKEKDQVIRLLAEANNQLTSALTTQEKTMQRQIKQLEKQLQQYQAAQEAPTEAITPAKSKRTPSKRTPATKRKASGMPAISPAPKRLIQAIDKAPLAKTKGSRLSTITRSRSTKA